jgi:hypothetical protein
VREWVRERERERERERRVRDRQGETKRDGATVDQQITSLPVTSTTHSFALRAKPTPRGEERAIADERSGQINSSPLTSTTHSSALRAKTTPRGEERVRADQELTSDLHYSQLCSQSKAHSKRWTERAKARQELTPDFHYSQLCYHSKAQSTRRKERESRSGAHLRPPLLTALLSEQSPFQEEKREREQSKTSPLTSTTRSFELRANPTPRGKEWVSADQEITCGAARWNLPTHSLTPYALPMPSLHTPYTLPTQPVAAADSDAAEGDATVVGSLARASLCTRYTLLHTPYTLPTHSLPPAYKQLTLPSCSPLDPFPTSSLPPHNTHHTLGTPHFSLF